MSIEGWNKFTLHQKLGNIGGEVARARMWDEEKDIPARNMALERVLEMLERILNDNVRTAAKKELAIAKQLIEVLRHDGKELEYSPRLLEEYFTQFSYLIK
jgi:hypothetical protein